VCVLPRHKDQLQVEDEIEADRGWQGALAAVEAEAAKRAARRLRWAIAAIVLGVVSMPFC